MDLYCTDCECITEQIYKGSHADGNEFCICTRCGCENDIEEN